MAIAAAIEPNAQPNAQANGAPWLDPVTGRLRENGLASGERNYALWLHLSPLLAIVLGPIAVFAPLALWLIRRDGSSYIDDHGREVLNMSITGVIFMWIPIVGLVWLIVAAVSLARGAVAASAGEYFRYPMIIRFLS